MAGVGDAVGESSFNEEGACISVSKESPAVLGEDLGVGVGLVAAFVRTGVDFSDRSSI